VSARRSELVTAWRSIAWRIFAVVLVALLEAAGAVTFLALGDSPALAAEVRARVTRSTLSVGESTTLEVTVTGAIGAGTEPDFDVPAGIEVLGSDKSQSYSWVNGRGVAEVVYRYELAPNAPGQYMLGPIQVRMGGQSYASGALRIAVSAAPSRVGGGGAAPVTLNADVSPRDPYVGQPVLVQIRMVQRARLAEDPQLTPPATPGFWIERFSEPESYYAQQAGQRVLVTEIRARLLPLAQGDATVGAATAVVVVSTPGPYTDPLSWAGGGSSRREITIRSQPVDVAVRSLPRGAPAGFEGAVGSFTLDWTMDRARTTEDVPATLQLDVRGVGNLPLLHTPALDGSDFEVFAGTVEDSAGSPGAISAGRRRFQWTLLPRRLGSLAVPQPLFAWFDPAIGAYRGAALPALTLDVDPPAAAGRENAETFPMVFASHPLDPDAQPVAPWAWAVAGLALGVAIVLWQTSRRKPADSATRAQQREWLRVVGLSKGSDFWHAADQASAWVAERGRALEPLRRDIASARYGGGAGDIEGTRRRIVEELSRAVPPLAPAWPFALGAVALAVAGLVVALAFGPRPGGAAGRSEALAADHAARAGDMATARRGWQELWDRGARGAGLAARMAWGEVRAGRVGPAAAWVLRGESFEARDRALAWVAERVREGGGLGGATPLRWPVRRIEWAIAALVLGVTSGGLWPRRLIAISAAVLALACAAMFPLQSWHAARATRAVVDRVATLEGPDLELSAGQVVTVLASGGPRARVLAGRDIVGWLPVADLIALDGGR
jgi:hypothetical protein